MGHLISQQKKALLKPLRFCLGIVAYGIFWHDKVVHF